MNQGIIYALRACHVRAASFQHYLRLRYPPLAAGTPEWLLDGPIIRVVLSRLIALRIVMY